MENNLAMESKEAMVAVRAMDRREVTTTRAMESKEAMVGTKAMASKTTTTKIRAMGNKTTMAAVRGTTRRITTVATRAMVNRVDMVATRVMATRAMDSNKAMDNSLGMAINKVMGRSQAMVIIKATPRRKVDTRVGMIISTSTRMLRAAPSTRRRRSPRTLPATRAQAGETSIRWEVTCPCGPLPTIHSHSFQQTSALDFPEAR